MGANLLLCNAADRLQARVLTERICLQCASAQISDGLLRIVVMPLGAMNRTPIPSVCDRCVVECIDRAIAQNSWAAGDSSDIFLITAMRAPGPPRTDRWVMSPDGQSNLLLIRRLFLPPEPSNFAFSPSFWTRLSRSLSSQSTTRLILRQHAGLIGSGR
jgi:hypothetical protein